MIAASFDVPLLLVLAAAVTLGVLQVAAVVLARAAAALFVPGEPLAALAAPLLLFGLATAVAGALAPAHPTAASLGTLALAALVGGIAFAGWRRPEPWLALTAPDVAHGLGLAVARPAVAALGLALALAGAVAGLGSFLPYAVPGWGPLLAALALRPGVAALVAALAAGLDLALAAALPPRWPGDSAGLALAIAAATLLPLARPGLARGAAP
jgi:hypothetical protein